MAKTQKKGVTENNSSGLGNVFMMAALSGKNATGHAFAHGNFSPEALSRHTADTYSSKTVLPERERLSEPPEGWKMGKNAIVLENPASSNRISDTFRERSATRMHRGMDIATPVGTELKAQTDSQVAYSGWSNGYGNIVVLHHGNNVYSMYAHLDTDNVQTGDYLRKGDVFANTGNSGIGTGAHLHHEIWIQKGGAAYTVDPQRAFGKDLAQESTQSFLIKDAEIVAQGHSIGSAAFASRVAASFQPHEHDHGDHDHEDHGHGEHGHDHEHTEEVAVASAEDVKETGLSGEMNKATGLVGNADAMQPLPTEQVAAKTAAMPARTLG